MNIQHTLARKRQQRLYVRYRQIRQQRQINYTICAVALQLPIFTTWSKPEVYLNHTPYFHMEMLAIILELFSILYRCYYSQKYSGIIISGLKAFCFTIEQVSTL